MPELDPNQFAAQSRVKPLIIKSGQIQQIQLGDLLVDGGNDQYLVELTDDLDIYIADDGNDLLNDGTIGSPFLTIYRAVHEFSKFVPVGDTLINVHIEEGFYPIDIPVRWTWPYGANLTITGATTAVTGVTLSNYTGTSTDGAVPNLQYFDVDATLASGTATVGQYLLITGVSGGTNNPAMYGLHEIIGVAGSVLTIRVWQRLGVSVLPSGAITVSGTIIRTVFNVEDVNGLQFDNASAGTWSGIVLRRDTFGGNTGIFLANNAAWLGSSFGVDGFATGVLSDRGSFFRSSNGLGISKISSIAIAAQDSGAAIAAGTGAFINGTVLQALNSARSGFLLLFSARITACGGTLPVNADEFGNIELSAGSIQYQSAANQTALQASRYGRIVSAVTITGYDVTERTLSGGSILTTIPRVPLETYNASASPISFERLIGWWDSNVAKLETQKGSGGGTARDLALGTDGTTRITIGAAGGLTIADANDVVVGTTTGTMFGTAVSQKLSFWGAAPIVQPAAANQAALTNSTGGAYDGTLAAVGDTSASDQSGVINDNFTDLHTLVGELRTAAVNSGLIKGAA